MFAPGFHRSRALAGLAVLASLLALGADAPAKRVPTLHVPQSADSVTITPAAPLIVPGRRATARDTIAARIRKAEEQYTLARAFERQNQPVSAIVAYNNAIHWNPQIEDAHFRIGRLYTLRDRWNEAASEFAAELASHPEHLDAARYMGLAMAHLGDTAQAIVHLEELSRRVANESDVWQALGFAYGAAGRDEQAEAALRYATALAPRDADAWRDLGVMLGQRGRPDEARAAYRRAIEIAPGDAGAWVNLGNLEARAARFDSALVAYVRAEARDSTLRLAVEGQARALASLGRAIEAAEVRRRWLRRSPEDDDARLEAIEAFARLGRSDTAVEIAREGVREKPRSGAAHTALGIALASDAQWEPALRSLRTAESLYSRPEHRQGVREYIASLRARAPASARALFAADSVAHAAVRDTARSGSLHAP